MIDIKIDDDYKIVSDERNIILQNRSVIKGDNTVGKQTKQENIGKEVWSNDSFHRTIRSVIEEYCRERVLRSNVKTFEELYRLLNEIKDIISKIKDIDNVIDKSIIAESTSNDDKKVNADVKVGRNKNERIATEKDKKKDKFTGKKPVKETKK
jgi:hypothetical protein